MVFNKKFYEIDTVANYRIKFRCEKFLSFKLYKAVRLNDRIKKNLLNKFCDGGNEI